MSLRDMIRKELTRGIPYALILDEPFEAYVVAPARTPLRITGWGRDKKNISYIAFGWTALLDDTEFYIVEIGKDAWAIPVSTPHTPLLKVTPSVVDTLTEVVESFLYAVGADADEVDVWGEAP